ncbi:MAG: patatin-like phospholipase family protein [Planctomycetaceae bacterium]
MSEQQNWSAWFQNNLTDMWELFQNLIQKPAEQPDWTIDNWKPSANDMAFAWEMYVDMRTRISTQPLHFLSGDEATALDSLYRLFQIVRDLEKKHGVDALVAASITNVVLNSDIRPLTARWHQRKLEGKLHPEDLRREFRANLQNLQPRLQKFQALLLRIAGNANEDGSEFERKKVQQQETRSLEGSIVYNGLLGYDCTCKVKPNDIISIIAAETREIQDRRDAVGPLPNAKVQPTSAAAEGGKPKEEDAELKRALEAGTSTDGNASKNSRKNGRPYHPVQDIVGLAISGGGIRSATFALGVLQGLTQRGIFRQVDVVSTVSGGGYLGSFLSTYLNTIDDACGPTIDKAPFKPVVAGDSRAIRSLRNHSRYIQPSNFDRWLTTLGQVAYGIVSNLIILSFWVFMAVLATFLIRTELREIWRDIYAPGPTVVATADSRIEINVSPSSVSKSTPVAVAAAENHIPANATTVDSSKTTGSAAEKPAQTLDYWKLTGFTKVWIVATVTLVFLLPLFQRRQFRKDPIQAKSRTTRN